ncbi:MAG TPA: hypothetical protein PLA50_13745 [Bacteroidia bacterium]|nr:hypothetical protein [Bacteroidia bacterium]
MHGKVRDHLRRLDRSHYSGLAIVHWTHSIDSRKTGWLDEAFHVAFREALIHCGFLYELWCPAYCLMPDHIHLVWSGIAAESDQLSATAWLRRRMNGWLKPGGVRLQKQAYDHVLRESDRQRFGFEHLIGYVFANPERAGLIEGDAPRNAWLCRDSILPGYPEVSWQRTDPDRYWDLYWKLYHRALEE